MISSCGCRPYDEVSTLIDWYGVRILFESVHSDGDSGDKLFEDRIVLMRAATEDDARDRATRYGEAEQTEYDNAYGATVAGFSGKSWTWPTCRTTRSAMGARCTTLSGVKRACRRFEGHQDRFGSASAGDRRHRRNMFDGAV